MPKIEPNVLDSFELPVCFMYREPDIEDCHRKAILYKLKQEGLVGKELYPEGFVSHATTRLSPWNVESFFKQVDENVSEGKLSLKEADAIKDLYMESKNIAIAGKAIVSWGNGKKGSFIFSMPPLTMRKMLFKIDTNGMIQIAADNLPEDKREAFMGWLMAIPSFASHLDKNKGNYYIKKESFFPAIPMFLDCVKALSLPNPSLN